MCFRNFMTLLIAIVAGLSVLLTPLVMLDFSAQALSADPPESDEHTQITFFVDGVRVLFDDDTGNPFINEDGRTMMPVRAYLDVIGCLVDWEHESRTVITRKENVTVIIPVGENEILVNGLPVRIDTAAVLLGGRTYLPLRAMLEAYGYAVYWDNNTRSVFATELTAFNINGGATGVFKRTQLPFRGFDGISADITLPTVVELQTGDCPYVYFGFDWQSGTGNVEGGFQFIDNPAHPHYNMWTVFIRQGREWRWGNNIFIEQGETRHLNFYTVYVSENQTDLVLELDGREVIRKRSAVANFENSSVKTVISIAMSRRFDGHNCFSQSVGARIANVKVRAFGSEQYSDFFDYPLYSSWNPEAGDYGKWFGTSICVPRYIHFEADGKISIYLSSLRHYR